MSDNSIEEALRITLADFQLTRGEKRALSKVIEKVGGDERQLSLARNQAFVLVREQLGGSNDAQLIDWLSARQSVDVCVFTITDDRIKDAILAAHHRKVAIRIISDNDKSSDLGSDIEHLARMGISVRVDQTEYHMHHKYAIFDEQRLLTGSYNWTRTAASCNEENFIVTSDRVLLHCFRRAFDQLWDAL